MNKFQFDLIKLLKWSSSEGDFGDLEKLKKSQARRITIIGKRAIDLALRCIEGIDIDYIIYSSRHGELNLSLGIINSIIARDLPSPTKFAQSTHNSIAGLLCIYSNIKAPVTAISAGDNSFKMGMISALSHLKTNPGHKLLYLYVDAIVPDIYQEKIKNGKEDNIVCAILGDGKEFALNLDSIDNDCF